MDTAHWPQGIGVVRASMEGSKQPLISTNTTIETNINPNPNPNSSSINTNGVVDQRIRSRPQKEQALNCPRCNSTNTKFCYYNNYSLTQPRYFCKTCRRYWTEGGSLRNVPVGGGSRKNKRPSSSISSPPPSIISTSTSSASLANKKPLIIHDHHQNPSGFSHQGQDLNLAYDHHDHGMATRLPFLHGLANPTSAPTTTSSTSAMELLKTGMASRSLSSFMADHHSNPANAMFPNLGHHEFKPSLSFGLDQYDHHQSGFNNGDHHLHHGNNGERLLFPSADHQDDLKQTDHTRDDHGDDRQQFEQINRGQAGNSAGGYNWNGILGGGNW